MKKLRHSKKIGSSPNPLERVDRCQKAYKRVKMSKETIEKSTKPRKVCRKKLNPGGFVMNPVDFVQIYEVLVIFYKTFLRFA